MAKFRSSDPLALYNELLPLFEEHRAQLLSNRPYPLSATSHTAPLSP